MRKEKKELCYRDGEFVMCVYSECIEYRKLDRLDLPGLLHI